MKKLEQQPEQPDRPELTELQKRIGAHIAAMPDIVCNLVTLSPIPEGRAAIKYVFECIRNDRPQAYEQIASDPRAVKELAGYLGAALSVGFAIGRSFGRTEAEEHEIEICPFCLFELDNIADLRAHLSTGICEEFERCKNAQQVQ